MRLQLVADDQGKTTAVVADHFADANGDGLDDETGEPAPTDDQDGDGEPEDDYPMTTRWVLAVEDLETGDGRTIEAGGLTWRELPLPFMAIDRTTDEHDDARLVGNIINIERDGSTIYGDVAMIDPGDQPDVIHLQRLITNGDLRGVSVDLDNIEGTMVIEEGEMVENADGSVEYPLAMPRMSISAGRIMGATAVPFPAFMEAAQVAASLTAGATTIETAQDALTAAAAIAAPDTPPQAWFADPELSAATRLTVTDEGRVFGHLALWDSCHIGFQDRCVRPPRSESSYDNFHTGEILTAEGGRVRVGQITADSGHAPLRDNARLAAEHYDQTGWSAADVCCGEDDHGIWIAGALRANITESQLRTVMAADVSGDWRRIGKSLDLVGVASVNVPGFTKATFSAGSQVSLVASLPPCDTRPIDPAYDTTRELIASTIGRSREQRTAERDRLAWAINRHPAQRRRDLAAQVRGT